MILSTFNPRGCRVSPERGVSLVELLVSMSLLVLAGFILLQMLAAVASSRRDTQTSSQALYAAQEKLDEVLRQGTRVSTLPTTDRPVSMPEATRTVVGAPDPLGSPYVWLVTVTIQWKEKARDRSITLRSAVSS